MQHSTRQLRRHNPTLFNSINMELTIQLTADDYVKANFLHMRPRPFIKWVGFFLLLLAGVVMFIATYDAFAHKKSFGIILGIGVPLIYIGLLFGVFTPKRVKKIFLQQKLLQMPFSFSITEDGIFTKAQYGEAKLTWDVFRKWKKNNHLFLLYQSDVLFHMCPKRFFDSSEDVALFRKYLLDKIGPEQP